jgi:hypothetical protein
VTSVDCHHALDAARVTATGTCSFGCQRLSRIELLEVSEEAAWWPTYRDFLLGMGGTSC